jgi:hypothetical protein
MIRIATLEENWLMIRIVKSLKQLIDESKYKRLLKFTGVFGYWLRLNYG